MARPQSDATVFQAIACPTRRALLDVLAAGEAPVSALVDRMAVTQSAVSQQLGVLKSAGLVEERQDGRFRYYRARLQPLLEVQAWIDHYRADIERRLDALGEVLQVMDEDETPPPNPERSEP